jgi:tRNA(adenine34) deaminase
MSFAIGLDAEHSFGEGTMHQAKQSSKSHKKGGDRRWSGKVKTVSTFPEAGLFKQDAKTIAKSMASKKVSPKGIGSGIKMVQFYINRAGKSLPASQRRELERAKKILQEQNNKQTAGKRK